MDEGEPVELSTYGRGNERSTVKAAIEICENLRQTKMARMGGNLEKPLPYGRACLRILRRNIKHLDLNKENGA
jgi:hypothetical protein